MPKNPSKGILYESISMLHPNGTFMCFCALKKAEWYVSKGLAAWIDDKTFKLNFEPNGKGKSRDPYYETPIENKCVVCGSIENLNKHHVVPYVFRKRLPMVLKESNHHDVLPICIDCHENYEVFATKYKQELALKNGTTINLGTNSVVKNNSKILAARNLLFKIENKISSDICDISKIPESKIIEIRKKASEELTDKEFDGSVWADIIIKNIIEKDELFDFLKSWRVHFIQNTNPLYLPKNWSVDHKIV